jgi:transcriptional regulator with XRE-family HTH domain
MDPVEFGAYLKQLRKAKGLTLCEISEVSHPYMSQIENGKKGLPSPDIIRKLSTALGVTHIGMMIKAGHITEAEVLTMRRDHGIND